jgi:hypothetical protein
VYRQQIASRACATKGTARPFPAVKQVRHPQLTPVVGEFSLPPPHVD